MNEMFRAVIQRKALMMIAPIGQFEPQRFTPPINKSQSFLLLS